MPEIEINITRREKLKVMRDRLGIYHPQAGKIVGLGDKTLADMERGRIEVTDEDYNRIIQSYLDYEASLKAEPVAS